MKVTLIVFKVNTGSTVVPHAQYASMNEFTCSEHSVRIRTYKKRTTGKQP